MPRRKARTRGDSPHRGVVLVRRTRRGVVSHLARWRDPFSGKWRYVALGPIGLRNDDGRREWAMTKSRALAKERAALAATGTPAAILPESLAAAVRDYLARVAHRLRPGTVALYRDDLESFLAYAKVRGLARLERLTKADLAAFREHLCGERKRVPVAGGHRGEGKPGAKRRSPFTVNRVLASVKAFLGDARRLGRTPSLNSDSIADGLARVKTPRPRPAFLRSPELCRLLEAALRYDAETYALTRSEHDGVQQAGTTPRFDPISPLVLAALLTGCRLGELLSLPWSSVFLTPPDRGEVIIAATASKTARERSVDLAVAPSLVALFGRLRLRSEGDPYVFGGDAPLPAFAAKNAGKRLIARFGAPSFSWQRLRQTCATFLVNSPGIPGGASAYREAAQLGHSVVIAERNYVGLLREVPKEAATLEAAMGIEALAERVVEHSGGATPPVAAAAGR